MHLPARPPETSPLALLGIGIGVVAALSLAYGIVWWNSIGAFPGDTLTYYLAGLRLDSGHALYDLQAGDVWLYSHPELPLMGPPLIAVLWRPLAAFPAGSGMIIWLVAMNFLAVLAVAYALLGTRGWAGLLVLPLVPALTLLMGVGNLDAMVLIGLFAAWALLASGRDRSAGVLIGFLASLKLTPAVLIVWLVVSGKWRAFRWSIATGLVLAVVAVVGTEPGIWFRYLRVMREAPGIGRPEALLIIPIGFALIALLRRWPRLTFGLSLALIPLGSPIAGGHTWSLLLGVLAPVIGAWRSTDRRPMESASVVKPGVASTQRQTGDGLASAAGLQRGRSQDSAGGGGPEFG
jgi:hypothetical protein